VLETIKPARPQCVVISFDLAAIFRARQIGGVPIGWVLSDYGAHSRLKYEALQPEFLFCNHEALPETGALWRGPWHWAIYEIESLPQALALAARGVDYIETMAVKSMSEAMRDLPGA
jgi:glycerophosphoryl diester phosphodiesterase